MEWYLRTKYMTNGCLQYKAHLGKSFSTYFENCLLPRFVSQGSLKAGREAQVAQIDKS